MKRRLLDGDSHLLELVLQIARRPLTVVGQEEELVPPRLELLHEIKSTLNQPAAVVDHAVHVAHVAHRHDRWLQGECPVSAARTNRS